MSNIDPLFLQAGGAVNFTVVFVELAVGAAGRQVAGSASLLAGAACLARPLHQHALLAAAAEFPLAGGVSLRRMAAPCEP